MYQQVFSYCRHGRLEQVKAALDGGFDVCGQRDENGNTLLHCAAQNGLRCMCKAVLQGGTGSSLNLKNASAMALHEISPITTAEERERSMRVATLSRSTA